MSIKITALGQVGFIFENRDEKIIVDPYLSDYVSEIYGDHLKRQYNLDLEVLDLTNINLVLISHAHEDHCDPNSLRIINKLNNTHKIYGSYECAEIFSKNELDLSFFKEAFINGIPSLKNFKFEVIPSAHTNIEYNEVGASRFLGFIIKVDNRIFYHAGDTIPDELISSKLPDTIDYAFLPINERNYFRFRDGIIGNMSPKEALQWAKEINVKNLVPTHWDAFQPNSTYKEELEFLYNKENYEFNLIWIEAGKSIEI